MHFCEYGDSGYRLFGTKEKHEGENEMIGFYDYTVILTYLSILSGTAGIILCLNGIGHPYLGMFFLLFSGLCDTFDGKVARMKKDRTAEMKRFGIQIDSLADLIAFGVLPACIGMAMFRSRMQLQVFSGPKIALLQNYPIIYQSVLTTIAILYVLAAMIRLAYFNVMEESDQNRDKNGEKAYTGLPVTSAALIFPAVMILHILIKADLTLMYFGVMIVVGVLFLSKFKLKKPKNAAIAIMIAFGALEFLLLLVKLIMYGK